MSFFIDYERPYLSLIALGYSYVLLNENIYGSLFCLSLLPVLWADKVDKLFKKFMARPERQNKEFKSKINLIANLSTRLPHPDLSDYPYFEDVIEHKFELLEYLEPVLRDTGYLAAKNILGKIDPRIKLEIVNKFNDKDVDKIEHELVISVYITDSGWLGSPTNNTMISDISIYPQ